MIKSIMDEGALIEQAIMTLLVQIQINYPRHGNEFNHCRKFFLSRNHQSARERIFSPSATQNTCSNIGSLLCMAAFKFSSSGPDAFWFQHLDHLLANSL